MTDRIQTLTVVLERETRDDDATQLINAIGAMRNVRLVKLGEVTNGASYAAKLEERTRIYSAMRDVIFTEN